MVVNFMPQYGQKYPDVIVKNGLYLFSPYKYPDFDLLELLTIGTWEAEAFCVLHCNIDLGSLKVSAPYEVVYDFRISIC